MQILKDSIEANRNSTPLGHTDNHRNDDDKIMESPNPETGGTPTVGVAAAPPEPAIPTGRTSTPEANVSQNFYIEDTEVPVEEDSVSEPAIERLRQLLNNSGQKGAKIKFTVDMKEKEKDGRSGLRVDV